jgi:translation initiation factor IF-2
VAARTKVIDLAKELGVTSKDLMVALEEMGQKGKRAMSPLDTETANALRLKLGRGRELPEEPKPRRATRARSVTAEGAARARKGAPGKPAEGEPDTVELRPVATIVKPKPQEVLPPPLPEAGGEPPSPVKPVPGVPPAAPSPLVTPPPRPPVQPAPPLAPAAPPVAPRKPEPRVTTFRPTDRPATPAAPTPAVRPARPAPPARPTGPFSQPRITFAPPAPPKPPAVPRPAPPPAAPVAEVAPEPVAAPPEVTRPEPAIAAPAAVATNGGAAAAVSEAPAEIRRELIRVPESVTVGELAEKMRRKSGEVIKALLELGVMATVNEILDPTAAKLVADKFNVDLEIRSLEGELVDDEDGDPAQLTLRPPVVTVMGHVDHGKTSLLDAIRKTKVTEKEFGGITQHIGAYQVITKHGKVTFLDTPGHEAFTAMRARGAQATDIVILVVAADDGVMPQTIEAINHARAAGVPIIVAVNKIDKPEADPERVKRELAQHELVPEEWGGQTIFRGTSAKTGQGVDDLLEMTALQAEVLELKANPARAAKGVIVEGRLDRGRGPVATVLIRSGTLREGDVVVVGSHSGRVRALLDSTGKKIKAAGPSDPAEIVGLSGVPAAGDTLVVVADERKARQIAAMRGERERTRGRATTRVSLEDLHARIRTGEVKELRLVLKADVQGSAEALTESLERLSTEEVKLKVIHGSVGTITESDVMLASASNAIVIGFNVKTDAKAASQAQVNGVDLRTYNVIYEVINDLRAALSGMLAPEIREVVLGRAQVRQIFSISKLGNILGSYVQEGKIVRGAKVRIRRDTTVLGEGTVGSLKRFKDDVREVLAGLECGIGVDGVSGLQTGDIVEAFTTEEVARTL